MPQSLMLHIRENLSPKELRRLANRIEHEHGSNVHAVMSEQPHLHFMSSDMPPHVAVQAVRKQGYHACLVDL